MQGAVIIFSMIYGAQQYFILKKGAQPDFSGNSGQILIYYPTGAHIQVSHFGVSHLTLRQADSLAGTEKDCVRVFCQKAVVISQICPGYGVSLN